MFIRFFCVILALVLGDVELAEAQRNGSGLSLPRFISLRADKVHMRTGPGGQYPIEWLYRRRSLPVEVVAEYENWRKIRDWQGTQGWVHQSMLSRHRTFIVTGKVRALRSRQFTKSRPLAWAEPGVIGKLLECPQEGTWCRVEIKGLEGWLRRVEFWGVYREETLE